jgi:hypothetical protein
VHQFHDQRVQPEPLSSTPPDVGNMGVVQGRERRGFTLEAREPIGVGSKLRRENLHGDLATEPGVARAIHLAHAAGASDSRIS